MRNRTLIIALALAIVAIASGGPDCFSQERPAQQLLELLNQSRSSQGLEPLVWDQSLAVAARQHAEYMSRGGPLSHQYSGEADLATRTAQAGAHFQTIAENIALGNSAQSLSSQWMNSPPHRANILDPRLNAIGIAVVNRDGILYAAADFSRAIPNLNPQQVEDKVAALLTVRGITPSSGRQDARQTCEMNHGSAGGSHPMFVMRWEGSDLSRLPDALEQRIRSGRYRTATVGACTSANPQQAFSSYRVAVLLYQ